MNMTAIQWHGGWQTHVNFPMLVERRRFYCHSTIVCASWAYLQLSWQIFRPERTRLSADKFEQPVFIKCNRNAFS